MLKTEYQRIEGKTAKLMEETVEELSQIIVDCCEILQKKFRELNSNISQGNIINNVVSECAAYILSGVANELIKTEYKKDFIDSAVNNIRKRAIEILDDRNA